MDANITGQVASGASTLVNMAGSILGGNAEARAARIAAKNSKKSAAFESAQLRQQAGQERASSQREAIEQARQARLAQSTAVARAAASGAGASDPTVLKIIGDLAAEGEYNARAALFSGEERARGLEMQGAAADFNGAAEAAGYRTYGRSAKQAGYMSGVGHLLTGVSSFYEKYGGDDDLDTTAFNSAPSTKRTSYWKIVNG